MVDLPYVDLPHVAPTWLLVMRHAKARPPGPAAVQAARLWHPVRRVTRALPTDGVLTPEGRAEARDVGGALAGVLGDLWRAGQPLQVVRFLHEDTPVAAATGAALAEAYEEATAGIRDEHGEAPPPLPAMASTGCREVSAQVPDARAWLRGTTSRLTDAAPTPPGVHGAALLVGHEPGMSWLLAELLRAGRGVFSRRHDIPGIARAELMALRRRGSRWEPIWALTPDAAEDIKAVTAKVKSKMDAAKVFGGFVTALLTFVVGQYADAPPSTVQWAAVRGGSLVALGLAILLYFMTLFWYDRLLMPTRFWASDPPRGLPARAGVLLRPPGSALWVLYQNMQRVWRRLFVPATWLGGLGVAGFAVARIEPSGTTAITLAVGLAVVAAVAAWGWRSRPILGVED